MGRIEVHLGGDQEEVVAALGELHEQRVVSRLWDRDHTLWRPEPTGIANRLGWLDTIAPMRGQVGRLQAVVAAARAAGLTQVLLLGMGGSSLAPEVLSRVFGAGDAGLPLAVLDSTAPETVRALTERHDPARTLFVVSTKSGGTVETLSFFNHVYTHAAARLGREEAGRRFVAITDPRSALADLANEHGFRETFLNDPEIGGRFSALSFFGLLPAALLGIDLERFLERAAAMARACREEGGAEGGGSAGSSASTARVLNPGAQLGVILGELARRGREKLTLLASPAIASFGDWVEQLVAESTGKEGLGILPVVGEPLAAPETYAEDRLFVELRLAGETQGAEAGATRRRDTDPQAVDALIAAGHPVVRLELADRYDLAGQFFLWEVATAVAGWRLGINPFDQPDVEAAKRAARAMVAAYRDQGRLPDAEPTPRDAGPTLKRFLDQARPGDYVALQAYLPPSAEHDRALEALRQRIRAATGLATTVGYGPRFLHSTGQLHKGDAGRGIFVQLTADPAQDVPIPERPGAEESSISFGVLIAAQALGDQQALREAGRRVIRLDLGAEIGSGIARLQEAL